MNLVIWKPSRLSGLLPDSSSANKHPPPSADVCSMESEQMLKTSRGKVDSRPHITTNAGSPCRHVMAKGWSSPSSGVKVGALCWCWRLLSDLFYLGNSEQLKAAASVAAQLDPIRICLPVPHVTAGNLERVCSFLIATFRIRASEGDVLQAEHLTSGDQPWGTEAVVGWWFTLHLWVQSDRLQLACLMLKNQAVLGQFTGSWGPWR